MAEYTQVTGADRGWFEEKSTGDLVYLVNGTVRHRIGDTTGNVAVGGTLTATSGATSVAALATSGVTTTTSGVGAAASEGTLVSEAGMDGIHKTELTFTNTLAIAGAALSGGALVYTFPAVPILLLGAYVSGTVTSATETGTPELGLGTLVGSGANAVLSGVGANAENIITGTAISAVSSGGTAYTLSSGVTLCPVSLAASSVVHVNIADTWTATETLTYAGTLRLVWAEMS